MDLMYVDHEGNELAAESFDPDKEGIQNGYWMGRGPGKGKKHLHVTLPDGREASRMDVPEGDGPGSWHEPKAAGEHPPSYGLPGQDAEAIRGGDQAKVDDSTRAKRAAKEKH